MLSYKKSAELLLSKYEIKEHDNYVELFLPKPLTNKDKEAIISDYIDSENCHINYLPLIQNSKKNTDFFISDKIRLKAKRKHQEKHEFFSMKRRMIHYQNMGFQLVIKKIYHKERKRN